MVAFGKEDHLVQIALNLGMHDAAVRKVQVAYARLAYAALPKVNKLMDCAIEQVVACEACQIRTAYLTFLRRQPVNGLSHGAKDRAGPLVVHPRPPHPKFIQGRQKEQIEERVRSLVPQQEGVALVGSKEVSDLKRHSVGVLSKLVVR